MILIFKPFRIGDNIILKDGHIDGVVEEITLRHTVILNWQSRRIILPNSTISDETIINSNIHDPKICRHIELILTLDSDLNKARSILAKLIDSHPLCTDNRSQEDIAKGTDKVRTRIVKIEEYGVKIRAYAWSKDYSDSFVLGCDILEQVLPAFKSEGIKIALPRQHVVIEQES